MPVVSKRHEHSNFHLHSVLLLNAVVHTWRRAKQNFDRFSFLTCGFQSIDSGSSLAACQLAVPRNHYSAQIRFQPTPSLQVTPQKNAASGNPLLQPGQPTLEAYGVFALNALPLYLGFPRTLNQKG